MWSSAWTCDEHGEVLPLQSQVALTTQGLQAIASGAEVPVWVPWPLPDRWLVTGATHAGDERSGARASVLACSGPAPLGGAGDLVLVAEEPGVGLGSRIAQIGGPDPGDAFMASIPSAKVQVAGHPISLWEVQGPTDRTTYVGEALGSWLWIVAWPETAGLVVQQRLTLVDLRDTEHPLDLPFGARSPRLPV